MSPGHSPAPPWCSALPLPAHTKLSQQPAAGGEAAFPLLVRGQRGQAHGKQRCDGLLQQELLPGPGTEWPICPLEQQLYEPLHAAVLAH